MEHLERDKVLVNCQFGFRRGRSCSMNLLSFYARVIDIMQERDKWADDVYLDLKKAFDKVPDQRLVWKIKKIMEKLEEDCWSGWRIIWMIES